MNLNQITVPSIDVKKAIDFYTTLGLEPIVIAAPHYARFVCPDGASTFSIHQVETLPTGEGVIVYFECDDLDEQVARLQEAGVVFELEPTDQPWLWREARLKDIDGNQLVLFKAGENRTNPPWRVKEN